VAALSLIRTPWRARRCGWDGGPPRERREKERPSSDKANRAAAATVEAGGLLKTLGSGRRLAFNIQTSDEDTPRATAIAIATRQYPTALLECKHCL
jgi:hypothetical protein